MEYCVFCMSKTDNSVCEYCNKNQQDYVSAIHHLKPGSLLNGRYRVGAVLGEGGFGITYIGRDTNLDMKVAIFLRVLLTETTQVLWKLVPLWEIHRRILKKESKAF